MPTREIRWRRNAGSGGLLLARRINPKLGIPALQSLGRWIQQRVPELVLAYLKGLEGSECDLRITMTIYARRKCVRARLLDFTPT